jgi:hypothetical protein
MTCYALHYPHDAAFSAAQRRYHILMDDLAPTLVYALPTIKA